VSHMRLRVRTIRKRRVTGPVAACLDWRLPKHCSLKLAIRERNNSGAAFAGTSGGQPLRWRLRWPSASSSAEDLMNAIWPNALPTITRRANTRALARARTQATGSPPAPALAEQPMKVSACVVGSGCRLC